MDKDSEEAFWADFKERIGVGKTFHFCKMVLCAIIAIGLTIAAFRSRHIGFLLTLAAFCAYFSCTSAKLLFWDAYRS